MTENTLTTNGHGNSLKQSFLSRVTTKKNQSKIIIIKVDMETNSKQLYADEYLSQSVDLEEAQQMNAMRERICN